MRSKSGRKPNGGKGVERGLAALGGAIRKADVKRRANFSQPKPANYELEFCTVQATEVESHESGAEILIYETASNSLLVMEIARRVHASDESLPSLASRSGF